LTGLNGLPLTEERLRCGDNGVLRLRTSSNGGWLAVDDKRKEREENEDEGMTRGGTTGTRGKEATKVRRKEKEETNERRRGEDTETMRPSRWCMPALAALLEGCMRCCVALCA
jgi:hypothetical protein